MTHISQTKILLILFWSESTFYQGVEPFQITVRVQV